MPSLAPVNTIVATGPLLCPTAGAYAACVGTIACVPDGGATIPKWRRDALVGRARAVLDRNRRGTWTCPSATLYPHQWLWDSCFIAIGLAHVDAPRAADELRALFRGQWRNGMLPHMIFAEGSRDVGSRRVWRSRTRPGAPRDVATTCITQPPLVAIAVER